MKTQSPKKLVEVKERAGSWRTDIRFNQIGEEEYEQDHEMAVYNKLRNKLLKMYEDVFKEDLTPADRINAPLSRYRWCPTLRRYRCTMQRSPSPLHAIWNQLHRRNWQE